MPELHPCGETILVLVLPMPETVGSLHLPNTDSTKHRVGIVCKVGPGKELSNGLREPTGVEVGNMVLFHRLNLEHKSGRALMKALPDCWLPLDGYEPGSEYGLIQARDVLLVMEDDEAKALRFD